jgi:hypothetical protein
VTVASEFVVQVGPGNTGVGEKTSFETWEAAVQADLTDAQTRVYTHGGITGTISDGATLTGQNNSYVATVKICTTTQVMVVHDTAAETFEADEQLQVDASNHVSVDSADGGGDTVIAVAECSTTGASDSSAVNKILDGWTVDSTNYVEIRAASGHEAVLSGWDTSRYRLATVVSVGTAWGLLVEEPFTVVRGLQVELTGVANGNMRCIHLGSGVGASGADVFACYCRYDVTGVGGGSQNIFNVDVNGYFTDCIGDISTYTGTGGVVGRMGNSSTAKFYNCVAYGNNNVNYGFNTSSNNCTLKNCVSFNNVVDFSTASSTIDYCASDDGDGTNSVTPADWSTVFEDHANGDFRRKAADRDLYRAGVGPATDSDVNTTDMNGDARSGTVCEIGADEYPPASATTVYVNPDGSGDYITVQAAIDDDFGLSGSDLITVNTAVSVLCQCGDGTADTHLWCNRFTTDDTHNIVFDVESDYRHEGAVVQTGNVYRLSDTTDEPIKIEDDNVTVKNFVCVLASTAGSYSAAIRLAGDAIQAENCVCLVTGTGAENYGLHVDTSGGGTIKVKNCTFSLQSTATHYGAYEAASPTGSAFVHSCSFACTDEGYNAQSGSGLVMKDCILWADASGSGTLAAGSTYNAYKVVAGLGSYNWVSYVNKGSMFRAAPSGDLRTYTDWIGRDGTNLYADSDLAVTDDLVGTARPNSGNFYIGAHVPLRSSIENPTWYEGLGRRLGGVRGPFRLRRDFAGWALGQMFDPKRGAGE